MTIEEITASYEKWRNGAETLAQSLRTALGSKNAQEIEKIRDALRAHLHKCPSTPIAKIDHLTLDHLQDLF